MPGVPDQFAVFEQMGDLAFDALGMTPVVGVVHGDELAGRFGETAIAGDVGAGVGRLHDHPNARIVDTARTSHRIIGAGVVDHEDLESPPRLRRERP